MPIDVGRSELPILGMRDVWKPILACEKRVVERKHALGNNNEWCPESCDAVTCSLLQWVREWESGHTGVHWRVGSQQPNLLWTPHSPTQQCGSNIISAIIAIIVLAPLFQSKILSSLASMEPNLMFKPQVMQTLGTPSKHCNKIHGGGGRSTLTSNFLVLCWMVSSTIGAEWPTDVLALIGWAGLEEREGDVITHSSNSSLRMPHWRSASAHESVSSWNK
jgi:hypothetical protein